MIYATDSAYYNSFLTTGRHKPTNEEVVEGLNDIKKKVRPRGVASRRARADHLPPPARAQNKGMSPEEMAATLRNKSRRAASAPDRRRATAVRPRGPAGTRRGSSTKWTGRA